MPAAFSPDSGTGARFTEAGEHAIGLHLRIGDFVALFIA